VIFMWVIFKPAVDQTVGGAAVKLIELAIVIAKISLLAALLAMLNMLLALWVRNPAGVRRERRLFIISLVGLITLTLLNALSWLLIPYLLIVTVLVWMLTIKGRMQPRVP
jgi:hypothetical protein